MKISVWLMFQLLTQPTLSRLFHNHAGWPNVQPPLRALQPTVVAKDRYIVNGTGIPDVDFDVGESYAGLIPITSDPDEEDKLFFWYFVSSNDLATDEILIWLNGGPGASSLEGLLEENGPFLWQFGTFKPVSNPWTWLNLTNVVWVEQPIGTGFTQGKASATTEEEVAQQFLGFWHNFVDTFDMQGREIYIAGESYAGMYIPYIAEAMFAENDPAYYNLQSTMLFDPLLNNEAVMQQVPAVAFVDHWNNLIRLNQTFMRDIRHRAITCGYSQFLEENIRYPPPAILPSPPQLDLEAEAAGTYPEECDIWNSIVEAAMLINPCFDIYQIATTCPLLWDVLGFPGTLQYLPEGAQVYFDRPEVKSAINAPQVPWSEASPRVIYNTTSGFSENWFKNQFTGLTVLPSVIEHSKRTVIGHSGLGFILLSNGTLMTIQNMTWGGLQGFQSPPKDDFFVPYHTELSKSTMAGAGIVGKTHTERGLTFLSIEGSGHMGPQYAPAAAYRALEFLLGRIPSLTYQ
ncbi:Alpha/Beta hydrolase protein [Jackrogersella minutella]|nr:Alpha/Beta hydrolase protein [Jackrogersella minutella]